MTRTGKDLVLFFVMLTPTLWAIPGCYDGSNIDTGVDPTENEGDNEGDNEGAGPDGDTESDAVTESDSDTESETGDTADLVPEKENSRLYPGPCEEIVELGYLSRRWYSYDDNDRVIASTYDFNFDGIVDEGFTNEWDNEGNLVHTRFERPGLEIYDHTYTYDAEGNMLSDTQYTWQSTPSERTAETQFNARGQKILERTDDDADGEWDVTIEWIFDEYGNLERVDTDVPETGWYQQPENDINVYENGLLMSVQRDIGKDGIIDQTHEFEYNDAGLVTRELYTTIANNGSGEKVYRFDDAGRLLSYEHHFQNDDYTIDESENVSYSADGHPALRTTDYLLEYVELGISRNESHLSETYNNKGILIIRDWDSSSEAAGKLQTHKTYTEYDEERGAISFQASRQNSIYTLNTYRYDEFGNILQQTDCTIPPGSFYTVDETSCNDTTFSITTYTYSCFNDSSI